MRKLALATGLNKILPGLFLLLKAYPVQLQGELNTLHL